MLTLNSRIGVLGDIHGSMSALVTAFQKARQNGVSEIVQVGDFWLYDPRDIVKISRQAGVNGVTLYFFDGNHENFDQLGSWVDSPGVYSMSNRMFYLGRGTRFAVGDRSALAVGGATSRDRISNARNRVLGKGWWPREAITDNDVTVSIAGGDADILFSHDTTHEGVYLHGYSTDASDIVIASEERDSRDKLSLIADSVSAKINIHGHFHNAASDDHIHCLGMNGTYGNLAILDSTDYSVDFIA